jgi:hypothetical protein
MQATTLQLLRASPLTGLVDAIEGIIQRNPFTSELEKQMWNEQAGFNFPLLYLASLELHQYVSNLKLKNPVFLFATRDCCHWSKIFKKMFPNTNTHYFQCSRNMFSLASRTKHVDYNDYVNSLCGTSENLIYIDIHGTGLHPLKYFKKRFPQKMPYCFLLSTSCKSYSDLPSRCYKYYKSGRLKVLAFNLNGGPIEMINYDQVGTLQNYSASQGPIRDSLEYEIRYVKPYHQCIDYIIKHLVPIEIDGAEQSLITKNSLFKDIAMIIHRQRPIIAQHIKHIGRHAKNLQKNKSTK